MAIKRKGLGRGLSALIPEGDMELLRRVARGEDSLLGLSESDPQVKKSLSAIKQSGDVRNNIGRSLGKEKRLTSATQTNGAAHIESASSQTNEDLSEANESNLINLNEIEVNPYQPRRFFHEDELNDLANSIREHGVIQPIIVRPLPKNDASGDNLHHFQLIAGERRWRASKIAGLKTIPAMVRLLDDQQALELALIENVQRHDISSIDAALAYQRLANEFKLSQEDIARRVGKSRSAVANTLRLLDLSSEIRVSLEKSDITEGHGRAILLAPGEGARRALFRRLIRDKLSVREVERLAKLSEAVIEGESPVAKSAVIDDSRPSELRRIESALQKRLGARVSVRARARGGRITIEYSSAEELQRVIRSLGA